MEHSCFWALLSHGDLHFIYLPQSVTARDHFFRRSFFDFVHPDEVVFARQDLKNFMQAHTLGGSVTRCRLREMKNMQTCTSRDRLFSNGDNLPKKKSPQAWLVADVIMYVVTEGLILAFFHCDIDGNDQKSQYKAPLKCGDYHYKVDEAHETINVLRSHDAYHSNGHLYSKTTSASQRIFQILDNRSKRLLVSWPDGYDDNQSSNSAYQKMTTSSLFDTTSKSDTAMKNLDTLQDSGLTCIQRTCINSCTSYLCGTTLKTVERVLITYGNIVFGLFRLSDSKPTISATVQDETTRTPSIPTITMSIPNAKSISPPTVKSGNTSTISINNHPETTCTESLPVKNASTTNNNQIRETSTAVVTGKDVVPSHISNLQHDYTHSNLLIPYARRMCNFPQLSPISELPNTRNFASRPSESYFRSNQPKNPPSVHSCESCGTDHSPEWRRGPSGHKTLCNACGLRYSRSLARQTKAIQQQESFIGDSATAEDQTSVQKRPLSESDPPLLPPPYFRQQTHHSLSLANNGSFPPTSTSLSNLCDESTQQLSSRAREQSDRSEHSAPVHFQKLC